VECRSDFCGKARLRFLLFCGFAAQNGETKMRDKDRNTERTDDQSYGSVVIGPSGYYAAA
jgi:hypothetical protein